MWRLTCATCLTCDAAMIPHTCHLPYTRCRPRQRFIMCHPLYYCDANFRAWIIGGRDREAPKLTPRHRQMAFIEHDYSYLKFSIHQNIKTAVVKVATND